jgi:NAD(P)-dependent dehydrogenase (short-subunit alcohol dehydrogenase family)
MRERKLVVVTGAAGALGRTVVEDLRERGYEVAALDLPGASLDEVGVADAVHPIAVDLADRSSVGAAMGRVVAVGVPVGMVALAGGFRPSSLADLTEEVWYAMWRSNVASLLWCCQAVAASMTEGGSIVTVGSKTAVEGTAPVAHAASKAAVVRITELLAEELRPQRIRINCVLPSVIDTRANREWMKPDLAARAVAPKAIARVIAFLLGPDAGPVSGARIPVYGDA